MAMLAAASAAWTQQGQMTARDMFYSWGQFASPPQAGAAKKAAAPASGAKKKAASPAVPSSAPVEQAKKAPVTGTRPGPGPVPGRRDDAPQVVLASQKMAPLGLRYSLLKEAGGGTVEVDADSVFRSGDRIRITVMANDRAYLYIVQRGSSGNWGVLFPSQEINGGNNVIEKDRVYEIPAGHWFAFDQQPGKERLFIVLSRRPEPNLEKMMYRLQEGETARPGATPAAAPAEAPKVLMAMDRPINDALVQRVRAEVYARDLVFEKVDEKTPASAAAPAPKQEKAVYVVNKTGSAESRVVADVTLNHQ